MVLEGSLDDLPLSFSAKTEEKKWKCWQFPSQEKPTGGRLGRGLQASSWDPHPGQEAFWLVFCFFRRESEESERKISCHLWEVIFSGRSQGDSEMVVPVSQHLSLPTPEPPKTVVETLELHHLGWLPRATHGYWAREMFLWVSDVLLV